MVCRAVYVRMVVKSVRLLGWRGTVFRLRSLQGRHLVAMSSVMWRPEVRL